MKTVHLSLGSNMGNRIANLRQALQLLATHLTIEKTSSVYESVPHGVREQPRYYNMAVIGKTALLPADLLDTTQTIERTLGREANSHNLPRPIDIDILLYGEDVIETDTLRVPHIGMHERAFVLVPLEEIASFDVHPELKKPVIDLLDELGGYDEIIWRAEEQL